MLHKPIEVGVRYRVLGVGILKVIHVGRYRVTCLYEGGIVEISKAQMKTGWKLQPR